MEVITSMQDVCRVASAHDPVNNSECCYTFHTPFTKSILVNLRSFTATCEEMSMLFEDKKAIFVRISKARVEKTPKSNESSSEAVGDDAAPTKLAIGVEGGFPLEDDKFQIISKHSVVVMERNEQGEPKILAEMEYSEATKNDFPEQIVRSVDSILQHAGVALQQDVKAWSSEDEVIPVSKYANDLPFVENGVLIDPNPSAWKCQKSGESENLWLNLSDGYIGGGRKNWDGSGGSNGAIDHYHETGDKYPLVVKLGTITADLETADCYSYAPDEDGPVKVPNLAQLLEKRGIKIANLQKTVKSTAELEVELNATYAFDAITEAGSELQAVSGPGLQGLQNLGNSCYMNSVFQILLSGTVPELANRYGCWAAVNNADTNNNSVKITQHESLRAVAPTIAPTDVLCQTTKLACALTSGVFAKPSDDDMESLKNTSIDPKYRLAPRMMKHCIGKDHVDFRTTQQQDAAQFLQYFLERLDRAELGASTKLKAKMGDPVHTSSHLFSFRTISRLVCSADAKIKYKDNAPENIMHLRIPMEKAQVLPDEPIVVGSPEHKKLKAEDGSETGSPKKAIPTIDLQTCLDEWAAETIVPDIRWPHRNNMISAAAQTVRFGSFPRYLIVQLQRYELGPDWQPIKLEVNVKFPEQIDLTQYKSTGPKDGETLVPDDDAKADNSSTPQNTTTIDEAALSQLMDMGFTLNSCKRALTAVGGSDVEAAMGWVFEHNMDPDFNDPLPDEVTGGGSMQSSSGVDESVVSTLVASLGAFTADQVRVALKETNGAADRAADWLFSHMDDLDGAIAAVSQKPEDKVQGESGAKILLDDGEGQYSLIGMISHIGKNTSSGHYVAHVKRNGKWIIFNDEKVALSSKPPFEHAYLYLLQRNDAAGSLSTNY